MNKQSDAEDASGALLVLLRFFKTDLFLNVQVCNIE